MFSGPQTYTEFVVSVDNLFLAAILQFPVHIVCSVHMPHCVVFDYFGSDVAGKSLLRQNLPVLKWECQLTCIIFIR